VVEELVWIIKRGIGGRADYIRIFSHHAILYGFFEIRVCGTYKKEFLEISSSSLQI
jgi:hypothetical protein